MPTTTEPPVDPALAVDKVLTASERDLFRHCVLVGPMQGAEPADWISAAYDTDAFLSRTEPWWRRNGDRMVDELTAAYRLPRALTKSIVVSALLASIAINSAVIDVPGTVSGLAAKAIAWILGYIEARPDQVRPPRRVTIDWQNDDYVHVLVDGDRVFTADHDNHGGDGMDAAIAVATLVGERLGATVTTTGTPGR